VIWNRRRNGVGAERDWKGGRKGGIAKAVMFSWVEIEPETKDSAGDDERENAGNEIAAYPMRSTVGFLITSVKRNKRRSSGEVSRKMFIGQTCTPCSSCIATLSIINL